MQLAGGDQVLQPVVENQPTMEGNQEHLLPRLYEQWMLPLTF